MQRTPFEIPEQMRQLADRSVDQARKAFDEFLRATQDAVAKAEGSVKSMGEGAADVNRQAMAYVEENIASSFDYAQKLVQARTVEEITALQREYIERQMAAAAAQGKQLGDMMKRTVGEAGKKAKK